MCGLVFGGLDGRVRNKRRLGKLLFEKRKVKDSL